jgi:hypothetical protein
LNAQVRRAIQSRDIAVDDRSPPQTPHYRGDLERFNYTAHVLFADFLSSDFGKRYLRPVLGRPKAKGILLNDLDRALVEWIVGHYHTRGHAGLGGDSPLGRMEKFVLGKNGLPASGLPMALDDTQDLAWDFLWEESRVVNQLGLTFENRRYVNSALAGLLKLNSRSSERKIAFRFNPYAMGQVLVKIPGPDGRDVIHPIKWLPETEKYRPKAEDQQAAINPSFWEWKALFKAIRFGNTQAATATLAEALHAKREAEAAAGDAMSGAPSKKERTTLSRNRDMRQTYGQENLPTTSKDTQKNETATEKTTSADEPATTENPPARGRKRSKPAPRLLETAAGADAY